MFKFFLKIESQRNSYYWYLWDFHKISSPITSKDNLWKIHKYLAKITHVKLYTLVKIICIQDHWWYLQCNICNVSASNCNRHLILKLFYYNSLDSHIYLNTGHTFLVPYQICLSSRCPRHSRRFVVGILSISKCFKNLIWPVIFAEVRLFRSRPEIYLYLICVHKLPVTH